jgi:serine/threonine protein kinase
MMEPLTLDDLIKGKKLGEGTYGIVHAVTTPSGESFALKKLRMMGRYSPEGVCLESVNEVKFLQQLSHPGIIRLEKVGYFIFIQSDKFWLLICLK